MKAWSEWEITRHQVAISGRVSDGRGRPVSGAHVSLTAWPKGYKLRIGGAASAAGDWAERDAGPDRTVSREDGLFYFLDLPPGRYTVQVIEPRTLASGEKSISVSRSQEGNIKRAIADFGLSAK